MNKLSLLYVPFLLFAFSCKKDPANVTDPEIEHEEELITTLTLKLTDSTDQTNQITATFSDPDGDGGNEPTTFDTIKLAKNKTYFTAITLLDETSVPSIDITEEVEEEGHEHLFCFTQSDELSISLTDSDGTHPIGLTSTWKTSSVSLSDGFVKVSLKHQPDLKDGTCAPGETDIELEFILTID